MKKRRFLNKQDEDSQNFSNEELQLFSNAIKPVKFPLDYESRYQLFRNLLWNFPLQLLNEEDYHSLGKPKFLCGSVLGVWVGLAFGLSYYKQVNPEIFYKKFLFTPLSGCFAIVPFVLGYLYHQRQKKVYRGLYDKYVGNLTDIELLQFELKFNPRRKVIYDYILNQNKPEIAENGELINDQDEILKLKRDNLLTNYQSTIKEIAN
eukprot:403337082